MTTPPIIRIMGLHALAYCERLFYLEEIEEIRVADDRVYAGRTLHETEVDKQKEWRSIELESEEWGIRGKVDYSRYRDGKLIAVEHKKGRSKGDEAWDSDILQVAAYAVLLSEYFGKPVEEGRIRYHATNKTIKVPIDEDAKTNLKNAIKRARELSLSVERPPVTENEKLCAKCSLAPVCLPEEERLARIDSTEDGISKKVHRFFPQHQDGRILHLTEPGSKIKRAGLQFIVAYPDEREDVKISGKDVSAIILHGNAQITSQAIHFAISENIAVHWLTSGGKYAGGVSPPQKVQRQLRQYKAMQDEEFKLTLAQRLVKAKIENQINLIARSSRSRGVRDAVAGNIESMQSINRQLDNTTEIDTMRGLEGIAARYYFMSLKYLIKSENDIMQFNGRSRRPPRDEFNAALSFGYALLYRDIMASIISVGLEPSLGFIHMPRTAAYPLALDIMELFRVIMWDIALIASANRNQWKPEHFVKSRDLVWLSDEGRRQAIQLYETRRQETWKHPVIGYSLSYARTIELEIRLLEKEWAGEKGLFAQLRLR